MRLSGPLALASLAAALAGCQTYDFEPVSGVGLEVETLSESRYGVGFRPNVMVALDRSASMRNPVDATDQRCQTSSGPCKWDSPACPAGCPTRWSEMKIALRGFLGSYATTARYGLVEFPKPGPEACLAPTLEPQGGLLVPFEDGEDDDAALRARTERVREAIEQSTTGGGTPTNQTLRGLLGYSGLSTPREDFVLLVTDGLPNCNAQHPATSGQPSGGCICTLGSCTFPNGTVQKEGCLDDAATAEAVRQLRSKGIRTIVVGFGADVDNAIGLNTLNTLASAGGFARTCHGTSQCDPGDTCNAATRQCGRRFYQARNGSELGITLDAIARNLPVPDPCRFEFGEPADPSLISVLFDGRPLPRGEQTWRYDGSGPLPAIQLVGAICQRLMRANPASAIPVEIRIARPR